MTYGEFLSEKFGGKNWVLARRTPRILRQYGEDVLCVSQKQYAEAERAWRVLYGDPYDKVRAKMYQALVGMDEALRQYTRNGFDGFSFARLNAEARKAREAITAEQNER